jgi:hypothetical protein
MTPCEFKDIAPQSNFTLSSFLTTLKCSSIGESFSCTEDSISLNSIYTVPANGNWYNNADLSQVALVISSTISLKSLIDADFLNGSISQDSYVTFNDSILTRIQDTGMSVMIIAVFDLH